MSLNKYPITRVANQASEITPTAASAHGRRQPLKGGRPLLPPQNEPLGRKRAQSANLGRGRSLAPPGTRVIFTANLASRYVGDNKTGRPPASVSDLQACPPPRRPSCCCHLQVGWKMSSKTVALASDKPSIFLSKHEPWAFPSNAWVKYTPSAKP